MRPNTLPNILGRAVDVAGDSNFVADLFRGAMHVYDSDGLHVRTVGAPGPCLRSEPSADGALVPRVYRPRCSGREVKWRYGTA